MMNETLEPRFEILIDRLAGQVQECLQGETSFTETDLAPVVGRFREEGFGDRKQGRPLWTLVEDRVVDKYPEPAIHRREELQSLISTIKEAWVGQADLKKPEAGLSYRPSSGDRE